MENNSETLQICRTCMKELVRKSLFFNLDFTQANTELTIRQKLYDCIPELDLSIIPNAVICYECADIVTSIYKFKNECFQTEMKIHKYIQQANSVVDLIQALQFHRQPYGNLRMELKTETSEVIRNFKADKSSLYDTNTCNEAGKHTESTENEYLLSLEKVDLEDVLFNTYSKSETKENVGLDDCSIAPNNIPIIFSRQYEYIQNIKKDTLEYMYQCYTCGHQTESKLKLIVHIKRHKAKKKKAVAENLLKSNDSVKLQPFQSNPSIENNKVKCAYSRRNSNNQSKHITSSKSNAGSHTLKKLFKCSVCEYESTRKVHLKVHMRTHTGEKPFKCQICEYQSSQKNNLKLHMQIHTTEKPFKCQVCEYKCSQKGNLRRHMQIHTGEKPFKCHICEYQCSQKINLKVHMQIHMRFHTSEKPFKCQVCQYECSQKSSLKIHMRIHTSEKPFKCQVCEYQCSQKNHLRKHLLIHTGEKPFKCHVCEYQCTQKSSLKLHLRFHTNEKPFKCQVCEYQCSQKSALKIHIRIHTGEKPFKCQICEFQSSYTCALKTHMRIHSGEKPFLCHVCEYRCSQKSALKIHMQIHTGERPFKCQICALKTHMRIHSGKKPL